MASNTLNTTCCVVGGGPAGVMLGYLLARAGVQVTVLEKHKDFNRDFRGDTVHPSTLELMYELGLQDDFLKVPHQELTSVGGVFGDFAFKAVHDKNRICGVEVQTPDGPIEVKADLVIGCDGRHSTTRQAAQLEVVEYGVPIDVLWFRISRHGTDPDQLLGNINYGRVLILINRGDYFQAGLLIRKGSFAEMQNDGLDHFHRIIRHIAPYLSDRVDELQDWTQISLLTVQLNRLRQWYRQGLLCIGDAAHAMSPAGGVGINLAIQDAVASANLLADPLREGRITEWWLAQVQQRREFSTRVTQQLQVFAHKGFQQVFSNPGPAKAPWQLKAAVQIPGIQHVMARVVGMGVRPEHIKGAKKRSGFRLKSIAVGVGVVMGVAALAVCLTTKQRRRRSWRRVFA